MSEKPQVEFDVRADLFRVARGFTDASQARYAGVRIEPLAPERAGVVMVGWNGQELIWIEDETGKIERPATIAVSGAMVNLAVDMFRRNGVATRLVGRDGVASIEPAVVGSIATREYERTLAYPDWRGEIARHAAGRMPTPLVFDARMARRVSEAAIGLALAAGDRREFFEIYGGRRACVAAFPAWPNAEAIFCDPPHLGAARGRVGGK